MGRPRWLTPPWPLPFFLYLLSLFFFLAMAIRHNQPLRLKPYKMARSIKSTITTAMSLSILFQFICLLYRLRARKAKTQDPGRTTTTLDSPSVSSDGPPPDLVPPLNPSNGIQHDCQVYYDLVQRLRQISPPSCTWLDPDDVQIIGTAAISSGGFSDVYRGSLMGFAVAVKTIRCYSSPDFDPAELGIVSLRRSARLG